MTHLELMQLELHKHDIPCETASGALYAEVVHTHARVLDSDDRRSLLILGAPVSLLGLVDHITVEMTPIPSSGVGVMDFIKNHSH